jgi:hypothetical protein
MRLATNGTTALPSAMHPRVAEAEAETLRTGLRQSAAASTHDFSQTLSRDISNNVDNVRQRD